MKMVRKTSAVYCVAKDDSLKIPWVKSITDFIPVRVTEKYFPVVLFIVLCKTVLTFHSMGGILRLKR